MNATYVAYYRVSTQKPGRSGLGMQAQQAAVEAFLNNGQRQLVAQFSEVETGKLNDRPQLQEALALCRKAKAVLLIAKLDRLSRCASFLLNLRDGGVPFTCCDMPETDRFTVRDYGASGRARARADLGTDTRSDAGG